MAKKRKALYTPRTIATDLVTQVCRDHRSLSSILTTTLERLEPQQRALAQELSFGTLRWYHQLDFLLSRLIKKPIKAKDTDIKSLLLVGLYQLVHTKIPEHAAISETVESSEHLGKGWAKGLINAVLRHYLREQAALIRQMEAEPCAALSHPPWLCGMIKKSWPQQWQSILNQNNQRPPMTLRINQQTIDPPLFKQHLSANSITFTESQWNINAVTLDQPMSVDAIPGFSEGHLSVQDGAAQIAATLLNPQPDEHILDLCAAPGGKTTHLLEMEPTIKLTAVDNDPKRLERVGQNLNRLHLSANVICGDATQPDTWWDKQPFDRVLLDAPCSATGVIRRHPDIKLLRNYDDIQRLVPIQKQILDSTWMMLKTEGLLLYATCSILPQENSEQIRQFLESHSDAELLPLNVTWGINTGFGHQRLPGSDGMDGFFYALIRKRN